MAKTIIHNVETNEIIEREMTKEELVQLEEDKLAAIARKKQTEIEKAKKDALLAKLGLTEEEVKLLLG